MSDTPLRVEPLPVRDVRHPVTRTLAEVADLYAGIAWGKALYANGVSGKWRKLFAGESNMTP
jgi:hypothetical protein